MPTSTELQDWDRAHVWHPFTPMLEYCRETTPVIVSAEGFNLIDARGRTYIDGTSSLWCNVHGHKVPELDAALKAQIDRVSHSTLLGLANGPSAELAKTLVSRVPAGLNHVFFSDDGSTAVEAALKIVFQHHINCGADPSHRNLFVSLGDSYHGDTLGAVSVGGIDTFHHVFGRLLFRGLKVPVPVTYRIPEGRSPDEYRSSCESILEETVASHADKIAAFVIEPLIQGAAGMLMHPKGYLSHVRELTKKYNIPLIADEVFVGFGRTGTLFACEQEEVTPDILCLSKGLTGGYLPLAATLVNDQIYQSFLDEPAAGKTFYHGHTFTGNPLGCAVALASLELFEERQLLKNISRNAKLLESWSARYQNHPNIGEIRQRGIVVALDIVQNRDSAESFPAASRIGHRIALAGFGEGIFIRPIGDVLTIVPAPGMPQEILQNLLDRTERAIAQVLQPTE